MSKRYWLMKSEPHEFSIDALAKVGSEPWSGVRNYQARNFMRDDMRRGDGVLFYHSNCAEPGVAATISRLLLVSRVRSMKFSPIAEELKALHHDAAAVREAAESATSGG